MGRRERRDEIQSTWSVYEARVPHAGFRASDMQVHETETDEPPQRAHPSLVGLLVGLKMQAAPSRPAVASPPTAREASSPTRDGTSPDEAA